MRYARDVYNPVPGAVIQLISSRLLFELIRIFDTKIVLFFSYFSVKHYSMESDWIG